MVAMGPERLDGVRHVGTHRIQGVDLAACVVTHLTVTFLRPLTQLADFSKHQDGASGKAGEYINGGTHGGGICVVTVIDHTSTARGDLRHGAALDRLNRSQACGNTLQADAHGMGSGGGGQGVADVVHAQHVELHLHLLAGPVQGEGRATAGITANATGMEIGTGIVERKAHDPVIASTRAPGVEGLVGQVENGCTALTQPFEDFALGLDDLVRAAEFTHPTCAVPALLMITT